MARAPAQTDALTVGRLRVHPLSVVVVSLGVVAVAGVFTFARPTHHPHVLPPPPDAGLPYTHVSYTARDARRAFADTGIELILHDRGPITGMSTADDVVEVDAFGDPKKVGASGFSDYLVFSHGRWSHASRTCTSGAIDAEQWRGNIRVILSCARAGSDAPRLLRLAAHALARL